MPVLTPAASEVIDRDAATSSIREIAGWLADCLGARMTAHLAGLNDEKQIIRYRRENGPKPNPAAELRLREAFKVVRTIVGAYDDSTARAWLFGTNSRLDDQAPIDLLRVASRPQDFTPVLRAARQLATFEN